MNREDELLQRVAADPGDSAFPELADLLMAQRRVGEALTTLLAGLSANPAHHVGRLVLARLYIHLGYAPFALRELEVLRRERPESRSIQRLIETIAPDRSEVGRSHVDSQISSAGGEARYSTELQKTGPSLVDQAVVTQTEEFTIAEGEFEVDILEQLEDEKPKT